MPSTKKYYKINRFVSFRLETIVPRCSVLVEWEPTTKKGKYTQTMENLFDCAVDMVRTGCFEEFRSDFQKVQKYYSQRLVDDIYYMREMFFEKEKYDLVLLADRLFEGMTCIQYGPFFGDTVLQEIWLHLDHMQKCKNLEALNGRLYDSKKEPDE